MDPLDDLNEALDDVEDALVERGFGVSAEVDIDGEHHLIYGKLGNEWGLYVRNATTTDASPRCDLLKASARLRLAATSAMPLLYDALAKARTDRDEATVAATQRMKELAARIRSESSPSPGPSTGEKK